MGDATFETISEHASFGGVQGFYRHASAATHLPMRFAVYRPPQAARGPVPVLFCLAGLTCNEETFTIKAGAQRFAAERGLMLVMPDTSPRNTGIAGEADDWEFGASAGFYLDATQAPWSKHFRMETWVVEELRTLVCERFPARADRIGITGHSMGGHGALVLALRHPTAFRSVSAFAPIAAPTKCPWGRKAFGGFLAPDPLSWELHDASALMRHRHTPFPAGIRIDQGLADQYLDTQLMPSEFEAACAKAGQPLDLHRHAGYDHGYWFVSTFIAEHIAFHHERLA
jgi:S-formylglutathione hydrolase